MYNLHLGIIYRHVHDSGPGNLLTIADVLEEVKYIVNRPGFY